MSTIKDRNCMDLTDAEGIKKRWQGNTDSTKKVLTEWITTVVWSLT